MLLKRGGGITMYDIKSAEILLDHLNVTLGLARESTEFRKYDTNWLPCFCISTVNDWIV